MARLYTKLIMDDTGITSEVDADIVEQLMRDRFRTLDNLSPADFRKEAKAACKIMRALDSETRKLLTDHKPIWRR
jgi:hypothetical protein